MGVLDGKSAIVTGSARGIGRATAELLAEQGATVCINDLDPDVAQEAVGALATEGMAHSGDLTDPSTPSVDATAAGACAISFWISTGPCSRPIM